MIHEDSSTKNEDSPTRGELRSTNGDLVLGELHNQTGKMEMKNREEKKFCYCSREEMFIL